MAKLKEISHRCMYGKPHEGNAWVVRGRVGNTIGYLCEEHKKNTWDVTEHVGFYLHSTEEMEARGDYERFDDDARDTSSDHEANAHEIEPDETDTLPLFSATGNPQSHSKRQQHHDYSAQMDAGKIADRPSGLDDPPTGGRRDNPEETGSFAATERDTPAPHQTTGQVQAQAIAPPSLAWWAGAGELVLEEWQWEILREPVDPRHVRVNFDGELYVPWQAMWDKFLRAFYPSLPALVPIGEPKIHGETISITCVLLVNGAFLGYAVGGMSKRGGNKKITYDDLVEGAMSNCLSRIGKRVGMNRELWDSEWCENWKRNFGNKKRYA